MISQGSDLFYYLFPLIVIAISLIGYRKRNTGKILLVLLLFFSMFRGDNVGNDTKTYMDKNWIAAKASIWDNNDEIDDIIEGGIGRQVELFYAGLNWIVRNYDLPPRIIIYTLSIIQLLFLYLSIKRLKVNMSLGLLFYVLLGLYFFSLSAARQMAAVSVFVYGATFLFDGGLKKQLFFFYIFLAASIHASAFFFIWLYLIRFINVNKQALMAIMVMACFVMIFTSFNVMDIIYRFVNVDYITDYKGDFDATVRNSFVSRIADFVRSSFLIYLFWLQKKYHNKCDIYDLLFGIAIILWAVFSHTSGLLGRITNYVVVFICIYEAKVIIEQKLFDIYRFKLIFTVYLLVCILSMRQWAGALRSGYYLMF